VIAALLRSMEARSTGELVQRRTYSLQVASAALFAALGCLGARGLVLVLFASEALGQALLAAQGRAAMRRGDRVVRYFARDPAGLAAALVFVATAASRYALALRLTHGARWVVAAAAVGTAVHLGAMLRPRARMDIPVGAALAGSALVLGVALVGAGAAVAAAGQLAYAALIVVGAAALRPWAAELINLAVFPAALALNGPV